MASVRKSINGALRMLGVVGGHGTGATNQELADSLDSLYGMYHQFISTGMFGRLRDIVPHSDYVAGENQRVFRRVNELQTIRLPDLVSSCGTLGYCLDACNQNDPELTYSITPFPTTDYGRLPFRTRLCDGRRTPRDLSVVVINDEISGRTDEAIYDAHQKKWFVISDFDHEIDVANEHDLAKLNDILDAEAPLSHRDFNGFRSFLAVQLADLFGAEITPTIARNAERYERNLATRFSEPRRINTFLGDYF